MQIAIDGPSGSGKSTISKMVAKNLGYEYLDTGAMYRCIALLGLRRGVDLEDAQMLRVLVDEIEMTFCDGRVFLFGEDVTEAIRGTDVESVVFYPARERYVRQRLVALQQKMAANRSIVMDGRDIGTVVLPNASLKIFLTASPEIRAERRMKQMKQKDPAQYEQVLRDIIRRDEVDSKRLESPLIKAIDAVEVDTSCLTIDEVVVHIIRMADCISQGAICE